AEAQPQALGKGRAARGHRRLGLSRTRAKRESAATLFSSSANDSNGARVLIGVISDTHGLLRPEAVAALRGAEHILHAGDIGAPEVLAALAEIAPVTAVRGNNDKGGWAGRLPATAVFDAG